SGVRLAALRSGSAGVVAAGAVPDIRNFQHQLASAGAVWRSGIDRRCTGHGPGIFRRWRADLSEPGSDRGLPGTALACAARSCGMSQSVHSLSAMDAHMTAKLPTIIVIGYNRPKSLQRLLTSLSKAHYPEGNIRLVISLDNSGTLEPLRLAEAYDWPYGEKRVIHHEQRLGLRNHVLACGDLTEEYGDVLVLEDDLFVSPYFYEYTARALAFYENEPRVAGISLYSQQFNQTANLPF